MIQGIPPELERILEAGNNAPSGENCQPWHFILRGNTIEVHLLPERDQSAYSWGQRASYLANGAAIENIVIAASAEGYRADVDYFPTVSDMLHVATISLVKDVAVQKDPLAAHVGTRISNRKSYAKQSLTDDERTALLSVGSVALVESPEEIATIGRVGSTNEEVMLANRSLHQFFFSHVNWTEEEDEKKKIGFYIKTLELPSPAEVMFKVFRQWSVMRIFSAIGFNRIVAKQNAATNASAAAMGAFVIPNIEPLEFMKIGRKVERLWLTATALGLSFQPLTGVLFFKLKIAGGEEEVFSNREKDLIVHAYEKASEIFKAGDGHVAFMFRVGRGDAPSAHAVRFPLEDVVTMIS